MRYDILLTADRTLMSNHHGNEFLGFGACIPRNILSDKFVQALFCPPIRTVNGEPIQAPYGLRKVEAQLLLEGFKVLTVDPDHLHKYLDEAKALGIYVMDPFGIGPASTTFAKLLKTGEPYMQAQFQKLLEKPELRGAKKKGLKIIVGGSGTWQFKLRPEFLERYGIDCVVCGEGEKVVGRIFRMALKGEDLPKYYEVSPEEVPSLEEIPEIVKPSINGLVEIGRGCCRGCAFCSVTLRPLRWYPYEKIEKELSVNAQHGVKYGVLHAEDVLLYGSRSVIPRREKVLELHKRCKEILDYLSWSHTSMAAVAADPELIRMLSEILIDEKQDWWGAEIGIETGSPKLIRKVMPAKARPFKPEQWPEVVREAAGIMSDNNLVPACTLIIGLPEETDYDIIKTIELMDDLREFKSLIVPLFFVPLGRLKDRDWFTTEGLSELHKELLLRCLKHSLRWSKVIIKSYFRSKWYGRLFSLPYLLFVKMVEWKARNVKYVATPLLRR